MTPYRAMLPPHRPARRTRRRFGAGWLEPFAKAYAVLRPRAPGEREVHSRHSLLASVTAYSIVAGWIMYATLIAIDLGFEMPSECWCDSSHWVRSVAAP